MPAQETLQASMASDRTAPARRWWIGVDIGGTFTDIVFSDGAGTVLVKKVPSTRDDYGQAVCDGIRALSEANDVAYERVVSVVHATTVATNAILENAGARTGLITTEGFRDVLEFRRVRIPELYDLTYRKPKPLVQRRFRLEVRERLGPDGAVRVPLDEASVEAAARRLAEAGVEAVAICLLHAYVNGDHEKRVEEIVRRIMPAGTYVCCSCDVLPEIREYERTSTTVVNAFLGPVMRRYLDRLHGRLKEIGLDRPLHVMQSGGGRMSAPAASDKPAYLVESGPAAGVVAAAHLAKRAGIEHVITLDIGGTTAKTAVVEGGEPTRTGEFEVGAGINLSSKLVRGAGYAIKLPFIDVSEIGSGGGSKVWFDQGGLMKVGPESAGADPGPVCYGRGGAQVTLTDAVIALGYINPAYLVGGELALDRKRARAAIEDQIAARLGVPVENAALGVFTVAVTNMVRAVKSVSTYRGRDPRDFTLIVFGGNGPLLGASIAEELEIGCVLVPPNSGVLSAYGLVVARDMRESVRPCQGLLRDVSAEELRAAFEDMTADLHASFDVEGAPGLDTEFRFLADLRYAGQAFELTVPAGGEALSDLSALADRFHQEHRRTYGHMAPDQPVELVNLRVIARGPAVEGQAIVASLAPQAAKQSSRRPAYFGPRHGLLETRILRDRSLLGRRELMGPLIIEEYDTTILAPPGWSARLTDSGDVRLSKGEEQ